MYQKIYFKDDGSLTIRDYKKIVELKRVSKRDFSLLLRSDIFFRKSLNFLMNQEEFKKAIKMDIQKKIKALLNSINKFYTGDIE